MRNFKLIFLLVSFVICTLSNAINAATVTVDKDNIRYTVDTETNEAEVSGAVSYPITNLVIPDYIDYNGSQIPITSIRNSAFSMRSSGLLGSLTIGNNVQTIGESAFYNCSGFTGSLTIGNSVQTIGDEAFGYCSGFTGSLTIPNSVQTIGKDAFRVCAGLSGSLTIPNSVQAIGEYAFASCSGFTGSLTIPNSVQTIGEYAFSYCSGFNGSLTIPDGIQTISDCAFYNCSGFTGSLTIPNSVQTIGEAAFLSCSGFTGDLIIPNSVQKIGQFAFRKCSGFTGSLVIPDGIQKIEESAFSGCSGFNGSLTIPNSVQSIEELAFDECSGFTGPLTIPNSVKSIGGYAFDGCDGFTSLTIGENVETIGDGRDFEGKAFNCAGLEYITCLAKNPPTAYKANFSSANYSRPLYVPAESVNAYKKARDWKDFQYINPIQIEATEITLNKTELSLLVGQKETLIATLTPEDASTEIVWSVETGAENIISVSQKGKVTALSVGTATVTATSGNVSASCEVTVSPVPASSVTLNVSDLKLLIGQSYTLQATVNPPNTIDQSLTWSSEENEVASVTPEGVVTAVSAGTSIITVKCGEVSTVCQVTVYGSDDVTVKPGSGTTTGSSDNSPANNTNDGASLIGNDLTLRVGQTGMIELELPQDLTEIPQFTWYIEATRPAVASMVNNSNTQASFLGESMGSVSYEVSLNSKTLVHGTITVIAENPMTSLRLNPEEISVAQNADPFQIKAEYTPDNADVSLLTWTSSQPSVATVANDGTVTILAQGETTITATATDGSELSAECQVTVTKPIDENFDFDFSDAVMDDMEGITIYLGETYQFKPKAQEGYVLPENISWSSDAAQTVSVTPEGLVKGEALGSATITASATVNGKTVTATCKVTVIPILASTVTVTPAKASIMAGGTTTLSASLTPDNVTDQSITWNSQNPEVATVGTNGEVKGISKGTAIITATCGEVSGQCEITVYDSTDVEVLPGDGTSNGEDGNSPAENTEGHGSLTGDDLTLRVNQTASVKLQLPSGLTTVPTLEWSIAADGTGIASIIKTSDLEAQFKGLAMGETTYSVKVAGTTEEVASGKVTVIAENPMTSLRLNPEEVSVAENADPFQIKAEYTPENADPLLLTWTSSQPSVATVSNDGTVTILAQGQTTITATATDGSELSATSQVTVTKPIDENFDFDFSDAVMDDIEGITIYLGETYQFKPKAQEGYVLPENISWSSDAAQTVSVTPEGIVKGEALGSATITASATVNGKTVTATCKVKVIPILASTVTVTPAKASIMVGGTTTLSASLTPDNVTDQAITWNSQNPEIATVGTNGEVKGISKGTAIITATCGEVSGQCEITVYDSTDVSVSPGTGTTTGSSDNSPAQNTNGHGSLTGNDLTLRINQTASIKLQLPAGLTTIPALEWEIAADGRGIASVMKTSDLEAQFKGLAMGETTYSVKVAGTTEEIASGKVTVIAENPMTSLRLNPAQVSVAQNADPFQITAEYTPENADVSLLNWTSSQPSVATVANDGTVTILAQGQTTITATATDGSELSAECQVTVTKPIDENFDFDFSDAVMDDMEGITIYLGETYQFKPKAQDGYVLPENISWSSDAEQTVSVTPEGLVKGEALGSATITASAMVNGKEVTATCVVKVIPIPASTIEIDGQGVKILKTTGILQLKATVMPENTTLADVTWQSSDPAVAQVSDQGLVTALTPGEVTITAFVTNQPTVKDEYKIQVQERLLGDANDNGVVNVADVGTISDYIVKKPVANFSFVNADVVPDKQITTADVTATIEIIFNDTPTVMAMTRSASNHPMTGDRLAVDDFNTNGKESTEIGIRLENSIDYVGIQGSIQIPEGMTVERIEKGPGAAGHILNYNITDDGNLIFILYSLDNLPLARGNDCLLNLFVKADESCEGIEIEDILASDINARQYTLTSTGGTNHGFTSWLEEIGDRQIRIYSQVGCITVSNARGERVEIYTFDGKTMVGSTATSDKETYRLAPGIYIVRVRDINVKLVVK